MRLIIAALLAATQAHKLHHRSAGIFSRLEQEAKEDYDAAKEIEDARERKKVQLAEAEKEHEKFIAEEEKREAEQAEKDAEAAEKREAEEELNKKRKAHEQLVRQVLAEDDANLQLHGMRHV